MSSLMTEEEQNHGEYIGYYSKIDGISNMHGKIAT